MTLEKGKIPDYIKHETVGSHFSESKLSLRKLVVGVTVFKSAVDLARSGNKARLARPSVARALETPRLSYTQCCRITRNFLRDAGGNDVANYPRELRRGHALGELDYERCYGTKCCNWKAKT